PIALTSSRSTGACFCRNVTAPEFQTSTVFDAVRRALPLSIVTVRPHGRGECSCEREPRPSDHPRPGLFCPPQPAPRSFDHLLAPHRPNVWVPPQNSVWPVLNLEAPSAD